MMADEALNKWKVANLGCATLRCEPGTGHLSAMDAIRLVDAAWREADAQAVKRTLEHVAEKLLAVKLQLGDDLASFVKQMKP